MVGIDLFAGAGGMSLGAQQAGIDVQVVVESDKYAATTYARNHPNTRTLFQDDIRKFDKKKLVKSKLQQTVLFGGPPCQGFSTSNQKTRSSKNENNWLFKEFLRVITLYRPDWVVFENVKGILETEGGKFADVVISELESLGYHCEATVLNASDFGVPQRRDRFFIVANLHNLPFQFPSKNAHNSITVAEALQGLPELCNGNTVCYKEYNVNNIISDYAKNMSENLSGCYNNLVSRNAGFVIERYRHIPQGGNWENIPQELMSNYKDRTRCHTGIYRRLSESQPSVVIGNYRKNMLIHPTQNRGLSVREAARLQSFPDNYIFCGSIGFQQQQVGNAVPPLMAKALFEKLMEASR